MSGKAHYGFFLPSPIPFGNAEPPWSPLGAFLAASAWSFLTKPGNFIAGFFAPSFPGPLFTMNSFKTW